jgi:DNA-binding MarR family transcriptional regulator
MKYEKKIYYFGFNTRKATNWHAKSGFTATEALALVALVLAADVGGMVYASQRDLAAIAQCSRQTLNKGLQSLIQRDLISMIKRGQYQISPLIGNKLA